MVNRATGREQSLQVTLEREGFAAISTTVRQRYSFEWKFTNSLILTVRSK